jgi:chromosome segregation ATPase
MDLGQNEEAMSHVEAATYEIKPDRFKSEYIELHALKGILYFLSSRFEESELILSSTITEFEKFNETDKALCEETISELNNLHGLMFRNAGDWDSALTEFQTALSYRKRANHRKEIGMILYNIANVFRYQQKSQQSISALEESIKTFKDIDYIDGLEAAYGATRDIYTEIGEHDNAYLFKQKLDELSERIKFKNYAKEATISKNSQSREIERLNAEIIQNKQEVWSLKLELNSLHDSTSDGESFSAQIVNKTKEELELVKSELENIKRENIDLKSNLDSLSLREMASSKSEKQEEESLTKIESLTAQVDHKTKEIEQLNILVEKKKSEEDEMQNVIKEYQSKVDNLESTIESTSTELESLKEEIKQKEDISSQDPEELQKAKEKIAELQIELEDTNIELAKLKENEGKSLSESDELKKANKQIADLQKELEDKDSELNKLSKKDDSTPVDTESLVSTNEEIAKLKQEVRDKEIQMDENLKQMELTLEELDGLKLKVKEMKSKEQAVPSSDSKETESQVNEMQKQINQTNLEKETLERRLKDMEASHKVELQNTVDEMKELAQVSSKSSMGEQVSTLNEKVVELRNIIKEKDMLIINATSKSNELNNKLESYELEVEKLRSENQEMLEKSSKVDHYKAQVEELQKVQASSPSLETTGSVSSSEISSVQDLLDSSKLAERIAAIVDEQSSIKLRFLAMQIGTSPAKCMDEIKTLREAGYVDLEYDSAGDSNPLIVKK